ncbi:MAG: 30S ribosomal protein S6 [Anaerolineae bacterium]|nr:30S ribosomal protein S6 [Anaerolineae bacterium]MCO5190436.1 30S ribosomal protein S6 [Anaerolineae bacterium]MCO5193218.1 30S ribosomal protein S6 [Anaerolineae bacterium]MCO5198162.1 30S ribosomal protein S6 [Anaerolineae bacterium]MCO5205469.1 30S ribosomal protein S6 [Anaerolineae bacterium]
MREYELTLVLHPDLDEQGRTDVIERVKGWMPTGDSEIKEDHWGQRKLAYPINKINDGYYVLLLAEMDTSDLKGMERNILYTEQILRHLVIRKDE